MIDPLSPLRYRSDFREHPAVRCTDSHWLCSAVYGRQLLKCKLKLVHPTLEVSMVRDQPQWEGLLEAMVDVLELREWPKPTTVTQWLRTNRAVLSLTWKLTLVADVCGDRGT